jgi:hypothetical protein
MMVDDDMRAMLCLYEHLHSVTVTVTVTVSELSQMVVTTIQPVLCSSCLNAEHTHTNAL